MPRLWTISCTNRKNKKNTTKFKENNKLKNKNKRTKKTDMRFLFDESSKKPQKPKFAAKIDVAP